MDMTEIILRLGLAAGIGFAIGINRYAHHKYIGVRTLGLVALTTAAIVSGAQSLMGMDAASHVIQGVVTGIGFLGAGVIMRGGEDQKVHGLTTAATVWLAAVVGILCGLGAWAVTAALTVIAAIVLIAGGPAEKWLVRRLNKKGSDPLQKPPDA